MTDEKLLAKFGLNQSHADAWKKRSSPGEWERMKREKERELMGGEQYMTEVDDGTQKATGIIDFDSASGNGHLFGCLQEGEEGGKKGDMSGNKEGSGDVSGKGTAMKEVDLVQSRIDEMVEIEWEDPSAFANGKGYWDVIAAKGGNVPDSITIASERASPSTVYNSSESASSKQPGSISSEPKPTVNTSSTTNCSRIFKGSRSKDMPSVQASQQNTADAETFASKIHGKMEHLLGLTGIDWDNYRKQLDAQWEGEQAEDTRLDDPKFLPCPADQGGFFTGQPGGTKRRMMREVAAAGGKTIDAPWHAFSGADAWGWGMGMEKCSSSNSSKDQTVKNADHSSRSGTVNLQHLCGSMPTTAAAATMTGQGITNTHDSAGTATRKPPDTGTASVNHDMTVEEFEQMLDEGDKEDVVSAAAAGMGSGYPFADVAGTGWQAIGSGWASAAAGMDPGAFADWLGAYDSEGWSTGVQQKEAIELMMDNKTIDDLLGGRKMAGNIAGEAGGYAAAAAADGAGSIGGTGHARYGWLPGCAPDGAAAAASAAEGGGRNKQIPENHLSDHEIAVLLGDSGPSIPGGVPSLLGSRKQRSATTTAAAAAGAAASGAGCHASTTASVGLTAAKEGGNALAGGSAVVESMQGIEEEVEMMLKAKVAEYQRLVRLRREMERGVWNEAEAEQLGFAPLPPVAVDAAAATGAAAADGSVRGASRGM